MANAQIIAVRLTPKASADRVGDTRKLPNGDEQLVVYVTAPPEDGKANEAMTACWRSISMWQRRA